MMKNLTLDNITQPNESGYQVRIVRRGKEISKYFSYNFWGGKKKALKAANHWRDQAKITLGNSTRRLLKPSKANNSTNIKGVSRYVHHDSLNDFSYLVYTVCWKDYKGKICNRMFSLGNLKKCNPEKESKAFEAAKKSRKGWEYHADNDLLQQFDPGKYRNWRKQENG